MQSWNMDPHKRDYVMDNGAPVETNSLQVPAFFRLRIKRKQWLYAPDTRFGSDFYTVLKRPSQNAAQRLENIGSAALQPMIDDGRADSVTVTADVFNRNGVSMTTDIVDASGVAQTATFSGLGI